MTEENRNEKSIEDQPEESVVMQLILTRGGQLKVSSNLIQDKCACYGLLELAKDAIRDAHRPQIIKPNGHGIMNFVRKGI